MKISKMNWLLIAVIGVLTLCSSSCTKEDDSPTKKEDYESLIVGKWRPYRYVHYDKYGNVVRDKYETQDWTITFQGDGTGKIEEPEYIDSFSYRIFRNILTVTYEDGDEEEGIIIKLTEEDLVLEVEDGYYEQEYEHLYYGRVY